MTKIILFNILLIFLVDLAICCTLDPSTTIIIGDTIAGLNQIKTNISSLNFTLSNYTRNNDSLYYLHNIETNIDKTLKLIQLMAYNVGYNSTTSITIKQYTEAYFPAISLTISLILLIIAVINLVIQCKKYRKPLTL
jgi:predicted PurR-regulated permease PerM